MKKLLIVAVPILIGVGGYFYYTKVVGGRYGITADHPVGQVESLEALLVAGDFEKGKTERKHIKELGKKVEVTEYIDTRAQEKFEVKETVLIMVDDEGTVRGISGTFMKPPRTQPMASVTPTRVFSLRYWNAAGGDPEPKFKGRNVGKGRLAVWIETATFSTDRVSGKWVWVEGRYMQTISVYSK